MKLFVISDHHLGHDDILTFTRKDGTRLRPFANLEQMHSHIISRHNAIVSGADLCFFLGDFAFTLYALSLLNKFNGRKILVRGNNDIFSTRCYLEAGFEEVHGVKIIQDVVLTHFPVHPQTIGKGASYACNIHGHMHMHKLIGDKSDRYFNVCLEPNDYKPTNFDALCAKLSDEK